MMGAHCLGRDRGFTLIEFMATVSIAAVLLAVAVPSFGGMMAKRRVEGFAGELITDLQYARSEAVARNQEVRVTFGPGCYVLHLASATAASCTQAGGAAVTPAAASIKSVQVAVGTPLNLTRQASLGWIEFEPVVGAAANDIAAGVGIVEVTSASGKPWQLQVRVTQQGRVKTCSPAGSGHLVGYGSDCSNA